MRSSRGAFLALAALGGFLIWRNRFAIQRQLESLGVRTPLLGGEMDFGEKAKSLVSKVSGRFSEENTERKVGGI